MRTHSNESNSEKCPLINPRTVSIMAFVDPLNSGWRMPITFTLDVFDLIDTSSHARAVLNGQTIQEGSTYSDFYGLGSSLDPAIENAKGMVQKYAGTGIKVEVITTMTNSVVYIDRHKKPVFSGRAQVFTVPANCFKAKDSLDPPFENFTTPPEEFVIWENGAFTPTHAELLLTIDTAKHMDAAGAHRSPPFT